ncbi:hypothetical protein EWM64_g2397 [Hericium alpestre]|uniref:Uncharacterized protein n=1 Tax=Hericium alpestre TaxID=135208 RepID=A0A4Z0A5G2_9AGAM|nr:hypothetical protein EWM64_g2397 [Hericium alpestre]
MTSIADLFSVKGRVAVITGAATGIGFWMAEAWVENGGKDELDRIVAEVSRHESSLDVLVNNAGLPEYNAYEPPAPMPMTYDQESWVQQFKLHTWSHGALTAAFVPLLTNAAMAGDGRGSVILVGSVSGDIWNPIAMQDGYATTKAGNHMLGKLLAAKLVNVGIRVNVV